MKEFKTVPITLITGYLGSGKTTLINYILKNTNNHKMAVIVNDIGEINIDADLIEKGGVVSGKDENLVALQNGCICCTLKKDLIDQLSDLVNSQKFDHILIEASGICEPIPIAQTITYMEEEFTKRKLPKFYKLDAIVSVTDALRLADEFGCGEVLEHTERGEEDIENLIIQQIEFCDVIILNKVNEVSKTQLENIKKTIKALQPNAKIVDANFCEVNIDDIIDTDLFDFEKAQTSAGWLAEFNDRDNEIDADHDHHRHHHDDEEEEHHHDEDCDCEECRHEHEEHEHHHEHHHHHHHHHEHGVDENDDEGTAEEYNISTYVYFRRRPFSRALFEEWTKKDYGRRIIRAKGVVYFHEDMDMSYVYESAGRQKSISENYTWYAASLTKRQISYYLKHDEMFRKDWDKTYGDRLIKLVFIGQNINKDALKEELDNL